MNARTDNASLPAPAPRFAFQAWLGALLVALLLYGLTMAPGVLWQDSGDVQVRVALDDWRGPYNLSWSHVLFFMLASGIRHAFGADPAWSANLVSVFAGAIAVANMAALLSLLLRRRPAILAATAMLALCHTLWQFSTVAETNALVGALLSAEMLALALFARSRRGRWLWLVGLFNGLGVSNHNQALLSLACYGLVALLTVRKWRSRHVRDLLAAMVLWLIGFSPMLVLIVGDLLAGGSVGEVLSSWLVGTNAPQVFNTRFGLGDAAKLVGIIGLNFPTPLFLAALFGWVGLADRAGRWLRITFALLLGVHFLFVARYDVDDQYSFMVPTYVVLTVFLGGGIEWLLDRCRDERRRTVSALVVLGAFLSPLVYAGLPGLLRRCPPRWVPIPKRKIPYRDPYKWFLQPWHCNYRGAVRFGEETLRLLPPNAVLVDDTTMRAPVLYLQNAKGLRRDVRVGRGELQPFVEFRGLSKDERRQLAREGLLFSLTADPYYLTSKAWIADEFDFVPTGPIFQVIPKE